MINTNDTARLLIEALPYIRRFTGKTIVVKVGGLPMTDPDRARSLAKDVLLLHSVGIRPVLVHGGGPQIDEQMARQGKPVERLDGLRVTDAEALDIVRMVLVGKINRELVSAVNAIEPVAVGVAGEDGRLLEAEPLDSRLGFVGRVKQRPRRAASRLARRRPGTDRFDRRRRRQWSALQRQCRRRGAGDRGGDGGGEDRSI